jgi:DNA repair protein RadC
MNYYQTFLNLPQGTVRESAGTMITTPEQCAIHMQHTKELAQETFNVITLDSKNRAIDSHMVGLGTLTSCLVHPREVFRAAILDNAAAVILSHNHPSGDSTPSSEDIKITRQLVAAGEVMGIKVIDHVIIGKDQPELVGGGFLSLREAGLVKFG